jgi:hypothetical protein
MERWNGGIMEEWVAKVEQIIFNFYFSSKPIIPLFQL